VTAQQHGELLQHLFVYFFQQQISPLYMLTAGMGGQRFSKISTNQQPQTSNQGKIFDPDALMQHMMMSSSRVVFGRFLPKH
jgi:hypothetical protein